MHLTFYPLGNTSRCPAQQIRIWVYPTAGLEDVTKRIISCPRRESNIDIPEFSSKRLIDPGTFHEAECERTVLSTVI
jgi:hypothetical protein